MAPALKGALYVALPLGAVALVAVLHAADDTDAAVLAGFGAIWVGIGIAVPRLWMLAVPAAAVMSLMAPPILGGILDPGPSGSPGGESGPAHSAQMTFLFGFILAAPATIGLALGLALWRIVFPLLPRGRPQSGGQS